ncbi:MAG TPA: glutaminyl-peptide cyclotransferase, partial [Flavisolibacter sp.]|nr:glutaminyl-peptide cyclotransferase [Flavisolibacter sp.]
MKNFVLLFLSCITLFMMSCNNGTANSSDNTAAAPPSVPVMSYSIISVQPHDTSFFTEGFEFYNNTLLESTGLNGKS